jgi:hypothetical protein
MAQMERGPVQAGPREAKGALLALTVTVASAAIEAAASRVSVCGRSRMTSS